ncbi:hypothetical protein [Mycolicibacterium hippocampi]|uniref:hypothetical protein n=1 Tax=Mycobacteriaceae TaxID=1762 RepID=UPI0015B6FCD6|nr:hypothetical protein [Mycolicibacterium hippocampi]
MTVNTDTATDSENAGELLSGEIDSAATASEGAGSSSDPVADPDSDEAETDSRSEDSDAPKADREAAKYRRQLRDTEAERDRLLTQVEGYHRAEVERLASSRLIDGSDVWAGGVALDSLLNDAGQVDPARVAQAVRDLAQTRPHWCRSAAAPASMVTSAGKPDTSGDQPATTWSDAFTRFRSGAQDG